MGDRTPIEVIVYSCPPERVNAVLEVFEEYGLGHEFVLPGDPAPGPANASRQRRLELGRGYIHSEISVGSSAEIAAALPSDAAWKVWEDLLTAPIQAESGPCRRTVRERLAGRCRCPSIC